MSADGLTRLRSSGSTVNPAEAGSTVNPTEAGSSDQAEPAGAVGSSAIGEQIQAAPAQVLPESQVELPVPGWLRSVSGGGFGGAVQSCAHKHCVAWCRLSACHGALPEGHACLLVGCCRGSVTLHTCLLPWLHCPVTRTADLPRKAVLRAAAATLAACYMLTATGCPVFPSCTRAAP